MLFEISTVAVEKYPTDCALQMAIVLGDAMYIFGLSNADFGASESKNPQHGSWSRV